MIAEKKGLPENLVCFCLGHGGPILENFSQSLKDSGIVNGSTLAVYYKKNYLLRQQEILLLLYSKSQRSKHKDFNPSSQPHNIIEWPGVKAVNQNGHITKLNLSSKSLYLFHKKIFS